MALPRRRRGAASNRRKSRGIEPGSRLRPAKCGEPGNLRGGCFGSPRTWEWPTLPEGRAREYPAGTHTRSRVCLPCCCRRRQGRHSGGISHGLGEHDAALRILPPAGESLCGRISASAKGGVLRRVRRVRGRAETRRHPEAPHLGSVAAAQAGAFSAGRGFAGNPRPAEG